MSILLGPLLDLVSVVLSLYIWVLIIAAAMSWLISFNVVNTSNRLVYKLAEFLYNITEPALRRIRRFMPHFGGIDISPVVLILALWFIQNVLSRFKFSLGV